MLECIAKTMQNKGFSEIEPYLYLLNMGVANKKEVGNSLLNRVLFDIWYFKTGKKDNFHPLKRGVLIKQGYFYKPK